MISETNLKVAMSFYFNWWYNGIAIINNDRDARDLHEFIHVQLKLTWKDIKSIVCNFEILFELLKPVIEI